jgi:hypothetical protein
MTMDLREESENAWDPMARTKCNAPIWTINRRRQTGSPERNFTAIAPIEQHKSSVINPNRWLIGDSLTNSITGEFEHWRTRKHESETFRDCRKAIKS